MATGRRKASTRPFTLRIDMRPIAKGRPRMSRRGKVYTPKRTHIAETAIADAYKEARGPFYKTPVSIEAVFNSTSIEFTISPLDAEHTSSLRGDTDNYMKLLCDALNGVAYDDDKRVMIVKGEKR